MGLCPIFIAHAFKQEKRQVNKELNGWKMGMPIKSKETSHNAFTTENREDGITCLMCLFIDVHHTREHTRTSRQYRACVEEILHEQAMYVATIHCTTASCSLGHLSLGSLLFMASLYCTLFNLKNFLFTCIAGIEGGGGGRSSYARAYAQLFPP